MIYFLYDSDGYYLGNSNIETENSTTIEPTLKDGYWSRFNGKKWTTEKIAESATDLDGVTIPDIVYDGVTASNHDKELYSLFERYLDDSSYIVKDADKKTLTFRVLTDEDLLKKAKIKKLEELTEIADQYDQYKCNTMYIISSVDARKFNADIRSQTNMQGLLSTLKNDTTVTYKDYDNNFVELSSSQLTTIYNECIVNGQNLYAQKWGYQFQIDACTSIDEVNAIEIKFIMLDFSKSE